MDELSETINKLKGIANRQIGVIELDHTLDIDEVTEIFIRINSKGTALSQSDFVMSKMAADTEHGGNLMRKAVDYFCHLAVKPEFYTQLAHDSEFQQSKYASKIQCWPRIMKISTTQTTAICCGCPSCINSIEGNWRTW